MTVATAPTRPRISDEFLTRNTRNRVLAGTAKAISEHGYCGASIADIVRACRCGRKTFYDAFGGKEQAALALVADVGIDIKKLNGRASLDVLIIEIAAVAKAGSTDPTALEIALGAEEVFRFLAGCDLTLPPPSDDPRQQSLPSGRHNLPAEFKLENQRTRLVSGLARAIADLGPAPTIQAVCQRASVSRRTFYEYFDSLQDATVAMVDASVETTLLDEVDPRCGLFAVATEIIAERIVNRDHSPFAVDAYVAMKKIAEAVAG